MGRRRKWKSVGNGKVGGSRGIYIVFGGRRWSSEGKTPRWKKMEEKLFVW